MVTLTGTYAGTYAIVASKGDNAVQIIDVSNPYNIEAGGALTDDIYSLLLQDPEGVDTFTVDASTYAIVTSFADDGVQIIDISNPSDIVATISLTDDPSLMLDGAWGIRTFTIGSSIYAIVTAVEDNGVQIIELSSTTGVSVVTSKIVVLPAETLSLTDFVTQPIAIPPPIEGTVNLLEFVILADVSITSDPGASSSIITDVIVTTGNEQIGVTWTIDSGEVDDVCNFQIWYATDASGPWILYETKPAVGPPYTETEVSTTITGISTFTTTFVKVVPIRCSTQCPEVESQVAWAIPTQQAPKRINLFFVDPQATTVWLDWNRPRTGGSEITLYEIQRSIYVPGASSSWSTILSELPMPDDYGTYSYQDIGLIC